MNPMEEAPRGDLAETYVGQTAEARPASIAEAFARNAERAPEKLCLRFEGEDWSYGRLRGRAGAFAAALGTWGLQRGDRVALFLGNHPDFLAAYLGTHLSGGVVVPVNKGYRRAELRHIFGVPTMYTRLLREAEGRSERPRPLRLYASGSAPLSPQAFERFEKEFGQRILERYGMTETDMNLTNPYDGERWPGTVGMPFPGQEARVVDRKTREVLPAGEAGEIEVRGPHVFAGYWERPEATAESFDDEGWFRTGDLGYVSEDGYFEISGRKKELIITGGYNVYPREVEELLEGCPGVAEVAVVGLPDPEFGEKVAAVVVRDDPALTAEEVVGFCREDLADYKKPRRVEFVDALPRNVLGKVLKHEVREKLIEAER